MPLGVYERKPRKYGHVKGTRQKVSARNNSSAWIDKRPAYREAVNYTPYVVQGSYRGGVRNSDEVVDVMEG